MVAKRRFTFLAEDPLAYAIDDARRKAGLSQAEYVRQACLAAVTRDGFPPAASVKTKKQKKKQGRSLTGMDFIGLDQELLAAGMNIGSSAPLTPEQEAVIRETVLRWQMK